MSFFLFVVQVSGPTSRVSKVTCIQCSHASRLLVWLESRGRTNIGNSIILGLLARYVEDSSVHVSHAIEPSISVTYLYTHSI